MALSPLTIAFINLAFQVLIIITVLSAAYLARKKRKFKNHCTIMRVAVPLQVISIIVIMFPTLIGQIEFGDRGPLFDAVALLHHSIGLAIVGLFVFNNLLFLRIIKVRVRLKTFMRAAFLLWMTAFLIGLSLFVQLWIWP